MIPGGKGGARTISGLHFEKRVSLQSVLLQTKLFTIKNSEVFKGKKAIGLLCGKHSLYRLLLEPKGVEWDKIISKKLLPDEGFFNYSNNTLYIIEIKFQNCEGSVDEKLQTCDFKNKQYKRLLSPLGIKVKYIYILNDWFKDPRYKDVRDYIISVDCHFYFNDIPLKELNIS